MRLFSVEHEDNCFSDDFFNGTYEECKAKALQLKSENPELDIQICEIEVDEDGIATYTYSCEKI